MLKPAVETSKQIEKARRLYLTTPEGIMDSELADILGVSRKTANRYRIALRGKETYQNSYRYTIEPSEEDIEFATNLLRRWGYRVDFDDYIGEVELEDKLQADFLGKDF